MEWLVIIAGFAFVATLAYSVYALDHHKIEKHQYTICYTQHLVLVLRYNDRLKHIAFDNLERCPLCNIGR